MPTLDLSLSVAMIVTLGVMLRFVSSGAKRVADILSQVSASMEHMSHRMAEHNVILTAHDEFIRALAHARATSYDRDNRHDDA